MTQTKRNLLASFGIAVMAVAFRLMWRCVEDLSRPFPAWEMVLLAVGAVIIMVADPVSYTAGRTRRY